MNIVKRVIIGAFSLTIIVLSIMAAMVVFSMKNKPVTLTNQVVTNQPAMNEPINIDQTLNDQAQIIPPTKTDCADELDTTCWNTYKNSEYGFEFKYPREWFIAKDKMIKGEARNFLDIDFDTGIKIIKNGEPMVVSLSSRSTMNKELGNTTMDYYDQAVRDVTDPNFKIIMDNGGVAVFDASNARSWWLIKLYNGIIDFYYNLNIPTQMGDNNSEPAEAYISIDSLNMIQNKFRQMVKTVNSL